VYKYQEWLAPLLRFRGVSVLIFYSGDGLRLVRDFPQSFQSNYFLQRPSHITVHCHFSVPRFIN
jgi:hypothetical protein